MRIGGLTNKPSVIPSTKLPPVINDDGSYTFFFIDYMNSLRASYATDTLRFYNYDASRDSDIAIGQDVVVNWVCGAEGIWKILSELSYEDELASMLDNMQFIAFGTDNITTQVDNLLRGRHSGYLSSSNAGNSNIPVNKSWYVDVFVNSANFAMITIVSTDNTHSYRKCKTSGAWASTWSVF